MSELSAAEKRDPGNPFVLSCRKFFTERGFLSDKQKSALRRVTKTYSQSQYGEIDRDECYADWSGFSGNLNGDD